MNSIYNSSGQPKIFKSLAKLSQAEQKGIR